MPSRPSSAQPAPPLPEEAAPGLSELTVEEVAGLAAALDEEERGELVLANDVFARFDAKLKKARSVL